MPKRKKQITFWRLRAVSGSLIYIATAPDDQELGTPFLGLCQYDAGHWSYENYDIAIADMTLFKDPKLAYRVMFVLDEQGKILNVDTKEMQDIRAGMKGLSPDRRLGHLLRIKQIGTHLYTIGDGGQNYRRARDDVWSALDPSLFDGPSRSLEVGGLLRRAGSDPEAIAKAVKEARADQSTRLSGIDGLDETTIYLCSEKGQIFWFDGSRFVEVPIHGGGGDALLDVLVETPERVWVCGRRGALLFGDRQKGFRPVASTSLSASFSRMTLFGGKLYLGAYANPRGLFVLEDGLIQRVRSGLKPDIEDVNMIEAVDGALWVMGSKDLLRFDGQRWERIDFPANDPVR